MHIKKPAHKEEEKKHEQKLAPGPAVTMTVSVKPFSVKILYHAEKAPDGRKILSAEQESSLGEGWTESPAPVKA